MGKSLEQLAGLSDSNAPADKESAAPKILLQPDKSFYDRVYLRTYEPDYVKRAKSRGVTSYQREHLAQQPYEGNPEQLFKSLLRKRELSQERTSPSPFRGIKSTQDTSLLDASARAMSLYHFPDFRGPGQTSPE
jgi:hypothetical protein